MEHDERPDAEAPAALGQPAVKLQLSQRELGNLVGAARETVNKCLREWQRSGLVRIEGTSITIADPLGTVLADRATRA